jgi:protein-disulfide isomerase
VKKTFILWIALAFLISGCPSNRKELDQRFEKIESRLAALEKLLMPPAPEAKKQTEAYVLPAGASAVFGKKDAPLSVTVFSNFQCPYCAKADDALRKLMNDAELAQNLNIVFKHFPFKRHEMARKASKLAMAAGEQGKFWEMSDKIFKNQDALSEANFKKWSQELALDMKKLDADLLANDKVYDDRINSDIELGDKVAHLEGTPWILIGKKDSGWLYEGDLSADAVKKFLEEKNLKAAPAGH